MSLIYEFFVWDSLFTIPQFDFFFKLALPKTRKGRIILERNEKGRILSSQVPNITKNENPISSFG